MNWLRTEPSETPLAQLARRLSGQNGVAGVIPVGPSAPSPERSPREVWALALRGEALATDRWRLWQDEAFWSEGATAPERYRVRGLEGHDPLRPELLWFFNQPGAGLAPTLRSLLASVEWFRPLTDPAVLGLSAALEGVPPRELLRQMGAGPAAPEHMAAALEHYTAALCRRVSARDGGEALSESAVDAKLYDALCGESMAAPRWTTEPGQLTPAERGAVTAVMSAVPGAMWGMLLKTRALLLEWERTQPQVIGAAGSAALARLRGFAGSDQLLRAAEAITGREYAFVQEVWDRRNNKAHISSGDLDAATILKRVGFFMNYASSIRGCALVGDRELPGLGGGERLPVIRPPGVGVCTVGDRIVLMLRTEELLVKLSGREHSGDPIIRRFSGVVASGAEAKPVIDLNLWGKRLHQIADNQRPEGELSNGGWTMAGQAWQPELMRALAWGGLLPDAGLSLVRGTPNRHQQSTMELIDELRRRR